MKGALNTVRNELKDIDIRIGVVSNTLLQCKLKERSKDSNEKGIDLIQNEYEIDQI